MVVDSKVICGSISVVSVTNFGLVSIIIFVIQKSLSSDWPQNLSSDQVTNFGAEQPEYQNTTTSKVFVVGFGHKIWFTENDTDATNNWY